MSSRNCFRFWATALLTAAVCGLSAGDAAAQTPPRGVGSQDFVDDLLKSLMDAERDRRDGFSTLSPYTRPGYDPAATSQADIVAARRLFNDFARETLRLTDSLNADINRVPGLRQYFTDALKVRARATVLAQRAAQTTDPRVMAADFQSLDQEWRALEYQLRHLSGLSRASQDSIAALTEYDRRLGETLKISAQFDRDELIRKVAALSAGLSNLIEDIEIELAPSTDRNQLLLQIRRVEYQTRRLLDTVRNLGDNKQIVAEYQIFKQMWDPLSTQLMSVSSRYLDRSVRRIAQTDVEVRQLLLLPQQVDRAQLAHLAEVLQADVDEFFVRMPLKLLITLPRARDALAVSDQFYGVCQHFHNRVTEGDSREELVEAYRYIDESWRQFNTVFSAVESQKAHLVLRDIEQGVYTIRDSLQVNEGLDRRAVLDLAANLENLADHLDQDLKLWLNQSRETFRAQALQESANFVAACRRLHADMLNNAQLQSLRDQVAQIDRQWRNVHYYASQCRTQDQVYIQRTSSQISPIIIELQTKLVPWRGQDQLLDLTRGPSGNFR